MVWRKKVLNLIDEMARSNQDQAVEVGELKRRISRLILPFRYTDKIVSDGYRCTKCGASNCKLWREYQTASNITELLCAICAGARESKDTSALDEFGCHEGEHGRTDKIGWMVPAIPTEDGETFWGYTSVPDNGCMWWNSIPTYPESTKT